MSRKPRLSDYFGANIRRLRKQQEMTQSALAERVGVSLSYVCQLERKNREPSLTMIEVFAKALGVDPLELLRATANRGPSIKASDMLTSASREDT
jgi:transcriptional regulator with XRE-family HTH domain